MGDAGHGLMGLRQSFPLQKPFADGSKPMQYGLAAGDVAASLRISSPIPPTVRSKR